MMTALALYALCAAVSLALLYLPYALLLRRETFFTFNRGVLLATLVLSFLLPFVRIQLPTEALPSMSTGVSTSGAGVFPLVYLAGVFFVLALRAWQLLKIRRFVRRNTLCSWREDGCTVYRCIGSFAPFSWMRVIVLPTESDAGGLPEALLHEKAHAALRHSWDVGFLSLCQAVQWFNPAVWLLATDLRRLHEYEADRAVLQCGVAARHYQLTLIRETVGRRAFGLANSFASSRLEGRLLMMLKPDSAPRRRLRTLYLLPMAAAALVAAAGVPRPHYPTAADSSPLIFVDGKPYSGSGMPGILPEDVRSICVFKNEAATSLYGERGKNGVIQIFTHSGASAPPQR